MTSPVGGHSLAAAVVQAQYSSSARHEGQVPTVYLVLEVDKVTVAEPES